MIRYFFRLDDISPNMNWDNFKLMVDLLQRYDIQPLIAVIPDVKDSKLLSYPINSSFWEFVKNLSDNSWIVAQHGYQHLSSGNGGILKIHKSGEFGGLNFENQKTKISAGRKIMEGQHITTDIFVAPRHSFDKETVKALKENNFKFVSDGIALWPFKKWGIVWLPQILWRPRHGMFGLITIALHSNTMTFNDFKSIEKFIKENRLIIGNFGELMDWYGKAGFMNKLFTAIINWPFKFFWRIIFFLKHGLSK